MSGDVLVTGASGFVGRPLVVSLAKQGWRVRAAARSTPGRSGTASRFRAALPDLQGVVDWTPLLDGVSHIVHLAGVGHAPGQLPEEAHRRINADSVAALAEAAKGKVERLVFLSSARAQAGLSAERPLQEQDHAQPTDAYGRSKLAAEALLADSGTPYTILRATVVYGPGVKGNIASLATLARTPMPLPFQGLTNERSLLSRENLISAIALALTDPAMAGETYLVADPEPISVAELVGAMRRGLGREPALTAMPLGAVRKIMKSFGREADWERISGDFIVDTSKLQARGWRPSVETPDGIRRMLQEEGAAPSI
jgi:UDP-glucose 4-epimerase